MVRQKVLYNEQCGLRPLKHGHKNSRLVGFTLEPVLVPAGTGTIARCHAKQPESPCNGERFTSYYYNRSIPDRSTGGRISKRSLAILAGKNHIRDKHAKVIVVRR